MIRRTLLPLVALLATLSSIGSADAANGYARGFGYLPYFSGFYQPYGIQYSTSVRTPPYFAVNPPVYYGARHSRPYGISPFASLPQVEAGPGYHSHLRPDFVAPPAPVCGNPFCQPTEVIPAPLEVEPLEVEPVEEPLAAGPLRTNPFAVAKVAAGHSSLQ